MASSCDMQFLHIKSPGKRGRVTSDAGGSTADVPSGVAWKWAAHEEGRVEQAGRAVVSSGGLWTLRR